MRQLCGSVYTWNCAGELYAIECSLCEERPLCALSEFSEHMDVWHSDWQEQEQEQEREQTTEAATEGCTTSTGNPEDELMQEVLAEQGINGEDNELKQQLVLQLNSSEEELYTGDEALGELVEVLTGIEELRGAEDAQREESCQGGGLEPSPVPEGQRLTTQHMHRLIDLYKSEPRLWNQAHAQFRDMELCRESWRRITESWSSYCGRSFSVTEVRIRVSTLCQRFVKQRERLEADGELDDAAKFVHFDQLSFLCEQQSLLSRQRHYARENRRLVELYEHYPVLWHNAHKRIRCGESVKRRHEALRGLQLALRLSGISLSAVVIQRRLQSLRKRYRLEKISYLHSVVEGKQAEFVSSFEHYGEMEFLHKHIDPYVCAVCGKIFENLAGHQSHVQAGCEVRKPEDLREEVIGKAEQEVPGASEQEKPPEQPLELEDADLPTLEEACAAAQLEAATELNSSPSHPPEEDSSSGKLQGLRLSLEQTRTLIHLYRSHVCLWDPNHLDYHARKQRHLAWQKITDELNTHSGGGLTWHLLHRKIMDYTKYYKREREKLTQEQGEKISQKQGEKLSQEQEQGEEISLELPKDQWNLYEEFRFLDDVLPISSELQKNLNQRDSNLKIIAVYQSYSQLWCTDHPDYTKRRQRQRQLELLCNRLQEEGNLQMTVERLKSRLIEFRCQYRHCKEARMEALKKSEPWSPTYEYYEPLRFLELHVSPFQCPRCPASFKRRTDYLQHERNVHEEVEKSLDGEFRYVRRRRSKKFQEEQEQEQERDLANVCHICGLKFALRSSLLAHLRRHLGQRSHACDVCPKKFFSSTALRVHQRSHTKELPYVCEHCARGFVNASKLNQHVKRHRNQRDFPCNRCEKAFYTAHERDRHLRAHLNIRDKVCPYCSRAFVVGSAYYAHLNLHRSEKRYACSACGKKFAQYAGLYKHRRRCLPAEVIEE
ncbi:hypothetical protein KR009_009915 [Drosophila setifemur]|nr:hypothetical protein KR009_009915 [Drosophila setifemur]